MKIYVYYNLDREIDIPKKEIKKALSEKDFLTRGHQLNILAQKYDPMLSNFISDKNTFSEITMVYDPNVDTFGEIIWG